MTQELVIFTGNIGAGKSVLAAKYAKKGHIVVNMDSITTMVQGGEYGMYDSKKKPVYHGTEHAAIISALVEGFNVVVDRTNMKASDRARYIEKANSLANPPRIVSVDFGPGNETTLARRLQKPNGIPIKQWGMVHDYMLKSYEKPSIEEGFSEHRKPPGRYYFRAVDFDGTIVENTFPDIGQPIVPMVSKMKEWWEDMSNITIIWTCRSGDNLAEMKTWLLKEKIPFDFINENPMVGWGSPKVYANEYHDDRSILAP